MSTRTAFVSAALLFCVGSVLASPVNVGKLVVHDGPGNLLGEKIIPKDAALLINPVGLVAGQFETFCLEEKESLNLDVKFIYDVDMDSSTHADPNNTNYDSNGPGTAGGFLRGGPDDPLSDQTAWLYSKFVLGTLAGYDYLNVGIGRANSADDLQIAIWYLEQERDALPPEGSPERKYIDDANQAVTDGFKNNGAVVVLNLYQGFGSGNRREYQDVLALLTVPLPTSAAAGLVMLGGLGVIRRRRA